MKGRRLAAVLRIRELQERGARGELAVRNERHRQSVEAERHTWDRLDRSSLLAQHLAALVAVRTAGTIAAARQRAITERSVTEKAAARGVWSTAARRVEALERLAERNRESEAIEAERSRNNELDDMVMARRERTDLPS